MRLTVTWVMVGLFVLSALLTVARVGKPRETLSGTDAVASVLVTTALILGVLYLGGVI